MRKFKKTAILMFLTAVSMGNVYASNPGGSDLDDVKTGTTLVLSSCQSSTALRRYGLLPKESTHPAIREFLENHPITHRGRTLLQRLAQPVSDESSSGSPAAAAAVAPSPALPSSYDVRLFIGNPTNDESLSAADAIGIANTLVPAYDQGQLGSCTANASARAIQLRGIVENLEKGVPNFQTWPPSRLGIYWYERNYDPSTGGTGTDGGASIEDSICALTAGVFPESLWPYSDQTIMTNVVPYPFAPGTAPFTQRPLPLPHGVPVMRDMDKLAVAQITATGADRLTAIKAALYAHHFVLAGITVCESFESSRVARNGMIPMPTPQDKPLGGHAIRLCPRS